MGQMGPMPRVSFSRPDISAPFGMRRRTTGATGVSPVDTLGQRASRPLRHDWDNGRPARCGTLLGQRASRPLTHTTGTTGVSPVEMKDPTSSTNGQDARCPSVRRRLVPPPTPHPAKNVANVIISKPAPHAVHSTRFWQSAPPSAGDRPLGFMGAGGLNKQHSPTRRDCMCLRQRRVHGIVGDLVAIVDERQTAPPLRPCLEPFRPRHCPHLPACQAEALA